IYLRSKGATIGQIERSGLVVKKDAGGYYDRFRGRLIFPVTDAQGRPVAFGARAMRAGDEPKYLNSPETAAYTKGRHLFGLGASRPDEFVRARGVEEYNERRGRAVPHMQFVLEQAAGGRNLRNPAQKAEAVEEVLPFVRAVRNPIQRREYFDMAMDALRVEEP